MVLPKELPFELIELLQQIGTLHPEFVGGSASSSGAVSTLKKKGWEWIHGELLKKFPSWSSSVRPLALKNKWDVMKGIFFNLYFSELLTSDYLSLGEAKLYYQISNLSGWPLSPEDFTKYLDDRKLPSKYQKFLNGPPPLYDELMSLLQGSFAKFDGIQSLGLKEEGKRKRNETQSEVLCLSDDSACESSLISEDEYHSELSILSSSPSSSPSSSSSSSSSFASSSFASSSQKKKNIKKQTPLPVLKKPKREAELIADAIHELADARERSARRKICSLYLEELIDPEHSLFPGLDKPFSVLDQCPLCQEVIGRHDRK